MNWFQHVECKSKIGANNITVMLIRQLNGSKTIIIAQERLYIYICKV